MSRPYLYVEVRRLLFDGKGRKSVFPSSVVSETYRIFYSYEGRPRDIVTRLPCFSDTRERKRGPETRTIRERDLGRRRRSKETRLHKQEDKSEL